MKKVGVGIIGCGRISPQYLQNLVNVFPYCLEVKGLADIKPSASQQRAEEFGIERVCTNEELLADPEVEIIVDLTPPDAHYEVNMSALQAGKHVYTEKPLAVEREEGLATLNYAREHGLLLGGAPDTILGAGLQTCRKLIDEGWIGQPLMAQAMIAMGVHGSAHYHTKGVGPMFDMGPYFVTGLISLLGPVARASGATRTPFPTKSDPNPLSDQYGIPYPVETPTVVSGVLDFSSGVIANVTTTTEIFNYLPRLEIYGTEGILTCNDPNMFGGPVYLQRQGTEKREIPLTHGYTSRNRGLGVADMAYALRLGRQPRASGELIYHALDVMHAIHEASDSGQHVMLESTVERPEPFAPGLMTRIFE